MGKKVARKPSTAVSGNKALNLENLGAKKNNWVFVAVLVALFAAWKLSASLHYLDPGDERLKEVFFGREPWLVLCSDGSDVDSVFEATSRKEKGVNFGVLDCAAPLPSKKTTFQRLNLNQRVTGPVLFFSGYGRDPKQLPAKLLRNQYVLRKEINSLTKMQAAKVKTSDQLYRKCLKKGKCGLVLAGGEMDSSALRTLNKAAEVSPGYNWVVLDSTKYKLRKPSEKDLGMKKYQGPGSFRLLMIGENDGTDAGTFDASPYLGPFAEDPIESFVKDFIEGPSSDVKKVDPEALSIMKRKPPVQQYRAPVSSPTSDPEATILPTAQQEENRKLAEARRAEREAARRAQMDAEAEDFIEYEGSEGFDSYEDDEDEEDEDEEDEDEEDEEEEDGEDILDLD